MRVLLISPPNLHFKEAAEVHIVEPLGIAYIASVLEQNGYEVQILDASALHLDVEDVVRHIVGFSPDVVGFSCLTPFVCCAVEIAQRAKKRVNFISVFGNTHPSAYPEMAKEQGVDYIVNGEGEITFTELIKAIECNGDPREVQGLYFYENGELVFTGIRPRIDLDTLPFPARHLLPMEKYRYSFPIYSAKDKVYASINCSRGCVYQCIFCSSPALWCKKITYRSADNIIAELKHLKNVWGVNTFYIRDEVFTFKKQNTVNICERMIAEKLNMNWFCYARADHLNEEMLSIMKQAGCQLVKIGVETGDSEIMKKIKKNESFSTIEKAFKMADRAGLYTHASFMVGHPWDSKESICKTIQFAKKLNADTTVFPISTPFPGTELYKIAKEEQLLLTEDFSKYGVINSPVMKTKYLDADDIMRYQKLALRSYYFRIGYILKVAKRLIKSPKSWRTYVDPFKTLLKWIH